MTPEELAYEMPATTVGAMFRGIDQRFNDMLRMLDERSATQRLMLDERAAAQRIILDERAATQLRAVEALALANKEALVKVEEKTDKSMQEVKGLIDDLKTSRDTSTGRQQGVSTLSGVVFAVIGVLVGVGGLVAAIAVRI